MKLKECKYENKWHLLFNFMEESYIIIDSHQLTTASEITSFGFCGGKYKAEV